MSSEIKIKRGDISWGYFVITYTVLLAVILAIISVLNINWFFKIIFIILTVIFLFWLCFRNDWFRNTIVGFITRLKSKEEVYKK
jgi:4-hydroxybenzoate polyprenyltransferase